MEITDNLDEIKVHLGHKVDGDELRSKCNMNKCRRPVCVDKFFKKFRYKGGRKMEHKWGGNMWTIAVFCICVCVGWEIPKHVVC